MSSTPTHVTYGEFEIVVTPAKNPLGSWVAEVCVRRGDQTVLDARPKTVQPEWLNEDEALRDGVEWGRRYIDHEFNKPDARSWVAERSHAETWFRDVEKPRDPDSTT
jgi:hypothetical protein